MKRRKLKVNNLILLIVILVCFVVLMVNCYVFISWNIDRQRIINEQKEISQIINVIDLDETDEIELINPPGNPDNDYWNYIKMSLIDVDINKLKDINQDTVGFISVEGTNINYPVVQAKDNDYYLKHSFKKNSNKAGWIFMDYRNNSVDLYKNTIIYGHGRIDTTMFGTLKDILNTSWINNKDNYIIKYVSTGESMLFQVFSVYIINPETYYLKKDFKNNDEYIVWLDTMIKRSKYNFNTLVDENDKVITLSTCTNNSKNRVVMHAKLIKKIGK